jgi:hypothetical protein
MQCEAVSFQGGQLLFLSAAQIYNTARLEAINRYFRPDWLSRASDTVIADRWRRFAAGSTIGLFDTEPSEATPGCEPRGLES